MRKTAVLAIVGTRPEAIKMAPVIERLKAEPWCDCKVLATGQHRLLLDQVLETFSISPDADLDVMQPGQSLSALTGRLFHRLDELFQEMRPTAVLAQGDTTSVMVAAMVGFYQRISFGHVEAGLRTGNLLNPFPEEMNRVIAGRLARWHFAPTRSARDNLLREGVDPSTISVTGNTVIDALMEVSARTPPARKGDERRRLILVTAHRRESFGEPMEEILRAIRHLADTRSDVEFLFPVHPNPNVRGLAHRLLSGSPRIRLCEPLEYVPFVAAMKASHLILSDSGGVQEEAPALGKPVLVLRTETERPEAVAEGVVRLVGTSFDAIVREASRLLDDEAAYVAMARGVSPYGDGHAAERIVEVLRRDLHPATRG